MLELLPNPKLIAFAKAHLNFNGKLFQKESGYIYLKIHDDFIYRLIQFVDDSKKQIPDYFFPPNDLGAHISIVYPNEIGKIISCSDIGHSFNFLLKSYFRAQIHDKVYFGCTVDSSSLNRIRASLGLSSLLNFRDNLVPFHFTIASFETGN